MWNYVTCAVHPGGLLLFFCHRPGLFGAFTLPGGLRPSDFSEGQRSESWWLNFLKLSSPSTWEFALPLPNGQLPSQVVWFSVFLVTFAFAFGGGVFHHGRKH